MNSAIIAPKLPVSPYPWQELQWQRITRLIETDKLPHALLLNGIEETGKLDFALALAARLLCQKPHAGRACGDCRTCKLYEAGSHPDLLRVEPEAKGKAISVDAIRDLSSFSAKTAMLGGWRIVIVNPTEAMTRSAANALLKTLEEPGEATLLLLIYHQKGDLLATIRSRCQSLLFPLPPLAQIIPWLRRQVDDDQVDALIELGSGRPLRALRATGAGMREELQLFERVMNALSENRISHVQAAEDLKALSPMDVIEHLLDRHCREIGGVFRGARLPDPSAFAYLDQLLSAKRMVMSKANPNPQLLAEELLMGWRHARSITSA